MNTATEAELSARLASVLLRTSRRLRREHAPEGSRPVLAALLTLGRHGPMTPSELAAHETIKRPTATTLIARMEELGLISRAAHPCDRRSCQLALTPQGAALLTRIRKRHNEYFARSLERLDDEERATMARAAELLERMLADEGEQA